MKYNYEVVKPDGTKVWFFNSDLSLEEYQASLPEGWQVFYWEVAGQMNYPIYRLIIETSPGRVDTGATYPQCSISNQGPCQGRQFSQTLDAWNYAIANGEIPVIVATADEAWAIVDAENQARAVQASYAGPQQSPQPQPGQGGPTQPPPTDTGGGISAFISEHPILTVGIGILALKLAKRV